MPIIKNSDIEEALQDILPVFTQVIELTGDQKLQSLVKNLTNILEQSGVDKALIPNIIIDLYKVALFQAKQELKAFLLDHRNLAVKFAKFVATDPDAFTYAEMIDKISILAFKKPLIEHVEQIMQALVKSFIENFEVTTKSIEYINALYETDPNKANKLLDLLEQRRYAKLLAEIQ